MPLDETIDKVLAGDRDAYAEIVNRFQDMLLAYAGYRLPNPAWTEEIVQQTFIRAYTQLDRYRSSEDFGTWLRMICKYQILTELKRVHREQRGQLAYRERLKGQLADSALAGLTGMPEGDVLASLQICISNLEPGQRALLVGKYEESFSTATLAHRFGRPSSWVLNTLFRLRAALRKCVERALRADALSQVTERLRDGKAGLNARS